MGYKYAIFLLHSKRKLLLSIILVWAAALSLCSSVTQLSWLVSGEKVITPSDSGISQLNKGPNYASVECAKVVESNSEAKKTSHILNDMNDEYMLNPCKAKIWFVIELCESIAANQIEIANYELFSSMPKDFSVYFSDTYPASNWKPVGEFTAADSRTLQAFDLNNVGFGKFIKVELHSHYGNEHYCPISEVKVYGESMVEEYEKKKDPNKSATDLALLSASASIMRKLRRKTSALRVYRNMMMKSTACGLQPSTTDEVEDEDNIESQGTSIALSGPALKSATFATGKSPGSNGNGSGIEGVSFGPSGASGSQGGLNGAVGTANSNSDGSNKKKKKPTLPQPTPAPGLRASVFVELSNQVKALETSLKTQIDEMQRRLKEARSGKQVLESEFSKLQLQFRSFVLIVISYFVYTWMLVLM